MMLFMQKEILATDGIISFSSKPLKIIGGIGICSIIISFIVLVYSLLSYIFSCKDQNM